MVLKIKQLINVRSTRGRVFCVLVLCMLGLLSTVFIGKDGSSSAGISQPGSQQPIPPKDKLLRLVRGKTFSQEIRVDSPRYLELAVIRYGIDITVQLVDANGTVLVSIPSRGTMYGPLNMNWKVRPDQSYFVRVTANNQTIVTGRFTLSINTRPVSREDDILLAAQRARLLAETEQERFHLSDAKLQYEKALKLCQHFDDSLKVARSLYDLGEVQSLLGETEKARKTYTRALALSRSASSPSQETRTSIALGSVYYELGQTNLALENFNRALELSKSVNDHQAEANALRWLGNIHERAGKPQSALALFLQSLSISEAINDQPSQASVLLEIGQIYNSLGQKQLALDFLKQAKDEAYNHSGDELSALVMMAENYQSLGDRPTALSLLISARTRAEEIGHHPMAALALYRLGIIYSEMGDRPTALRFYTHALMTARQINDRAQVSRIQNSLGLLYEAEGRLDAAESALHSALSLVQTIGDDSYEPTILYSLAKVKRKQGDLITSMRLIEQSLNLIDRLRYNIVSRDLRFSYFASVRNYYELYIDLLMELHKQRPNDGFDSTAFVASERAHGQSLLELLSETGLERQHIDPSLREREQVLRSKLSAMISDQLRTPRSQRDSSSTNIQQLKAAYEEVQVAIKGQTHKTLSDYEPVNLKEIQEHLQHENTLLLEYSLGSERSYLWAVTGNSISSYELPGRATVDQLVRAVHELLIAPKTKPADPESISSYEQRLSSSEKLYWEKASALSQVLFGSVRDELADKRLLIVSDGSLQNVPFEALPLPTATEPQSERQPLIFRHEVVSVPSASILMKLRQDKFQRRPISGSVVVVADPVFGSDDPRISLHKPTDNQQRYESFPRLYGARAEAEQILELSPPTSKIDLGFAANRDAIINGSLKNYQIVHFATHAVIDTDPALSGIVLSLFDDHGKAQNGFLLNRDIANLDLSADLVVLSACETGTNEGINGMTSSFFYAGAQSVLTSLWAVDDIATADLMARFYSGVLRNGMTPAAALRRAQIEMWQQPRWQHPYYWAAFSLQGNRDVSISTSVNEEKASLSLSEAAPLGICLLGFVYVLRRRRSRF
jgi:CHAT domain-containing protein/lipopolysaccharide biosynthesis regulator YciM